MTSNQTNQPNQPNAERQAAEFTASTNLWRAALRMEGLGEAVTEAEIDMVSRAMSILAQEGIEFRACENDKLMNLISISLLAKIFPNKGSLSVEEYTEYLLEQVE